MEEKVSPVCTSLLSLLSTRKEERNASHKGRETAEEEKEAQCEKKKKNDSDVLALRKSSERVTPEFATLHEEEGSQGGRRIDPFTTSTAWWQRWREPRPHPRSCEILGTTSRRLSHLHPPMVVSCTSPARRDDGNEVAEWTTPSHSHSHSHLFSAMLPCSTILPLLHRVSSSSPARATSRISSLASCGGGVAMLSVRYSSTTSTILPSATPVVSNGFFSVCSATEKKKITRPEKEEEESDVTAIDLDVADFSATAPTTPLPHPTPPRSSPNGEKEDAPGGARLFFSSSSSSSRIGSSGKRSSFTNEEPHHFIRLQQAHHVLFSLFRRANMSIRTMLATSTPTPSPPLLLSAASWGSEPLPNPTTTTATTDGPEFIERAITRTTGALARLAHVTSWHPAASIAVQRVPWPPAVVSSSSIHEKEEGTPNATQRNEHNDSSAREEEAHVKRDKVPRTTTTGSTTAPLLALASVPSSMRALGSPFFVPVVTAWWDYLQHVSSGWSTLSSSGLLSSPSSSPSSASVTAITMRHPSFDVQTEERGREKPSSMPFSSTTSMFRGRPIFIHGEEERGRKKKTMSSSRHPTVAMAWKVLGPLFSATRDGLSQRLPGHIPFSYFVREGEAEDVEESTAVGHERNAFYMGTMQDAVRTPPSSSSSPSPLTFVPYHQVTGVLLCVSTPPLTQVRVREQLLPLSWLRQSFLQLCFHDPTQQPPHEREAMIDQEPPEGDTHGASTSSFQEELKTRGGTAAEDHRLWVQEMLAGWNTWMDPNPPPPPSSSSSLRVPSTTPMATREYLYRRLLHQLQHVVLVLHLLSSLEKTLHQRQQRAKDATTTAGRTRPDPHRRQRWLLHHLLVHVMQKEVFVVMIASGNVSPSCSSASSSFSSSSSASASYLQEEVPIVRKRFKGVSALMRFCIPYLGQLQQEEVAHRHWHGQEETEEAAMVSHETGGTSVSPAEKGGGSEDSTLGYTTTTSTTTNSSGGQRRQDGRLTSSMPPPPPTPPPAKDVRSVASWGRLVREGLLSVVYEVYGLLPALLHVGGVYPLPPLSSSSSSSLVVVAVSDTSFICPAVSFLQAMGEAWTRGLPGFQTQGVPTALPLALWWLQTIPPLLHSFAAIVEGEAREPHGPLSVWRSTPGGENPTFPSFAQQQQQRLHVLAELGWLAQRLLHYDRRAYEAMLLPPSGSTRTRTTTTPAAGDQYAAMSSSFTTAGESGVENEKNTTTAQGEGQEEEDEALAQDVLLCTGPQRLPLPLATLREANRRGKRSLFQTSSSATTATTARSGRGGRGLRRRFANGHPEEELIRVEDDDWYEEDDDDDEEGEVMVEGHARSVVSDDVWRNTSTSATTEENPPTGGGGVETVEEDIERLFESSPEEVDTHGGGGGGGLGKTTTPAGVPTAAASRFRHRRQTRFVSGSWTTSEDTEKRWMGRREETRRESVLSSSSSSRLPTSASSTLVGHSILFQLFGLDTLSIPPSGRGGGATGSSAHGIGQVFSTMTAYAPSSSSSSSAVVTALLQQFPLDAIQREVVLEDAWTGILLALHRLSHVLMQEDDQNKRGGLPPSFSSSSLLSSSPPSTRVLAFAVLPISVLEAAQRVAIGLAGVLLQLEALAEDEEAVTKRLRRQRLLEMRTAPPPSSSSSSSSASLFSSSPFSLSGAGESVSRSTVALLQPARYREWLRHRQFLLFSIQVGVESVYHQTQRLEQLWSFYTLRGVSSSSTSTVFSSFSHRLSMEAMQASAAVLFARDFQSAMMMRRYSPAAVARASLASGKAKAQDTKEEEEVASMIAAATETRRALEHLVKKRDTAECKGNGEPTRPRDARLNFRGEPLLLGRTAPLLSLTLVHLLLAQLKQLASVVSRHRDRQRHRTPAGTSSSSSGVEAASTHPPGASLFVFLLEALTSDASLLLLCGTSSAFLDELCEVHLRLGLPREWMYRFGSDVLLPSLLPCLVKAVVYSATRCQQQQQGLLARYEREQAYQEAAPHEATVEEEEDLEEEESEAFGEERKAAHGSNSSATTPPPRGEEEKESTTAVPTPSFTSSLSSLLGLPFLSSPAFSYLSLSHGEDCEAMLFLLAELCRFAGTPSSLATPTVERVAETTSSLWSSAYTACASSPSQKSQRWKDLLMRLTVYCLTHSYRGGLQRGLGVDTEEATTVAAAGVMGTPHNTTSFLSSPSLGWRTTRREGREGFDTSDTAAWMATLLSRDASEATKAVASHAVGGRESPTPEEAQGAIPISWQPGGSIEELLRLLPREEERWNWWRAANTEKTKPPPPSTTSSLLRAFPFLSPPSPSTMQHALVTFYAFLHHTSAISDSVSTSTSVAAWLLLRVGALQNTLLFRSRLSSLSGQGWGSTAGWEGPSVASPFTGVAASGSSASVAVTTTTTATSWRPAESTGTTITASSRMPAAVVALEAYYQAALSGTMQYEEVHRRCQLLRKKRTVRRASRRRGGAFSVLPFMSTSRGKNGGVTEETFSPMAVVQTAVARLAALPSPSPSPPISMMRTSHAPRSSASAGEGESKVNDHESEEKRKEDQDTSRSRTLVPSHEQRRRQRRQHQMEILFVVQHQRALWAWQQASFDGPCYAAAQQRPFFAAHRVPAYVLGYLIRFMEHYLRDAERRRGRWWRWMTEVHLSSLPSTLVETVTPLSSSASKASNEGETSASSARVATTTTSTSSPPPALMLTEAMNVSLQDAPAPLLALLGALTAGGVGSWSMVYWTLNAMDIVIRIFHFTGPTPRSGGGTSSLLGAPVGEKDTKVETEETSSAAVAAMWTPRRPTRMAVQEAQQQQHERATARLFAEEKMPSSSGAFSWEGGTHRTGGFPSETGGGGPPLWMRSSVLRLVPSSVLSTAVSALLAQLRVIPAPPLASSSSSSSSLVPRRTEHEMVSPVLPTNFPKCWSAISDIMATPFPAPLSSSSTTGKRSEGLREITMKKKMKKGGVTAKDDSFPPEANRGEETTSSPHEEEEEDEEKMKRNGGVSHTLLGLPRHSKLAGLLFASLVAAGSSRSRSPSIIIRQAEEIAELLLFSLKQASLHLTSALAPFQTPPPELLSSVEEKGSTTTTRCSLSSSSTSEEEENSFSDGTTTINKVKKKRKKKGEDYFDRLLYNEDNTLDGTASFRIAEAATTALGEAEGMTASSRTTISEEEEEEDEDGEAYRRACQTQQLASYYFSLPAVLLTESNHTTAPASVGSSCGSQQKEVEKHPPEDMVHEKLYHASHVHYFSAAPSPLQFRQCLVSLVCAVDAMMQWAKAWEHPTAASLLRGVLHSSSTTTATSKGGSHEPRYSPRGGGPTMSSMSEERMHVVAAKTLCSMVEDGLVSVIRAFMAVSHEWDRAPSSSSSSSLARETTRATTEGSGAGDTLHPSPPPPRRRYASCGNVCRLEDDGAALLWAGLSVAAVLSTAIPSPPPSPLGVGTTSTHTISTEVQAETWCSKAARRSLEALRRALSDLLLHMQTTATSTRTADGSLPPQEVSLMSLSTLVQGTQRKEVGEVPNDVSSSSTTTPPPESSSSSSWLLHTLARGIHLFQQDPEVSRLCLLRFGVDAFATLEDIQKELAYAMEWTQSTSSCRSRAGGSEKTQPGEGAAETPGAAQDLGEVVSNHPTRQKKSKGKPSPRQQQQGTLPEASPTSQRTEGSPPVLSWSSSGSIFLSSYDVPVEVGTVMAAVWTLCRTVTSHHPRTASFFYHSIFLPLQSSPPPLLSGSSSSSSLLSLPSSTLSSSTPLWIVSNKAQFVDVLTSFSTLQHLEEVVAKKEATRDDDERHHKKQHDTTLLSTSASEDESSHRSRSTPPRAGSIVSAASSSVGYRWITWRCAIEDWQARVREVSWATQLALPASSFSSSSVEAGKPLPSPSMHHHVRRGRLTGGRPTGLMRRAPVENSDVEEEVGRKEWEGSPGDHHDLLEKEDEGEEDPDQALLGRDIEREAILQRGSRLRAPSRHAQKQRQDALDLHYCVLREWELERWEGGMEEDEEREMVVAVEGGAAQEEKGAWNDAPSRSAHHHHHHTKAKKGAKETAAHGARAPTSSLPHPTSSLWRWLRDQEEEVIEHVIHRQGRQVVFFYRRSSREERHQKDPIPTMEKETEEPAVVFLENMTLLLQAFPLSSLLVPPHPHAYSSEDSTVVAPLPLSLNRATTTPAPSLVDATGAVTPPRRGVLLFSALLALHNQFYSLFSSATAAAASSLEKRILWLLSNVWQTIAQKWKQELLDPNEVAFQQARQELRRVVEVFRHSQEDGLLGTEGESSFLSSSSSSGRHGGRRRWKDLFHFDVIERDGNALGARSSPPSPALSSLSSSPSSSSSFISSLPLLLSSTAFRIVSGLISSEISSAPRHDDIRSVLVGMEQRQLLLQHQSSSMHSSSSSSSTTLTREQKKKLQLLATRRAIKKCLQPVVLREAVRPPPTIAREKSSHSHSRVDPTTQTPTTTEEDAAVADRIPLIVLLSLLELLPRARGAFFMESRSGGGGGGREEGSHKEEVETSSFVLSHLMDVAEAMVTYFMREYVSLRPRLDGNNMNISWLLWGGRGKEGARVTTATPLSQEVEAEGDEDLVRRRRRRHERQRWESERALVLSQPIGPTIAAPPPPLPPAVRAAVSHYHVLHQEAVKRKEATEKQKKETTTDHANTSPHERRAASTSSLGGSLLFPPRLARALHAMLGIQQAPVWYTSSSVEHAAKEHTTATSTSSSSCQKGLSISDLDFWVYEYMRDNALYVQALTVVVTVCSHFGLLQPRRTVSSTSTEEREERKTKTTTGSTTPAPSESLLEEALSHWLNVSGNMVRHADILCHLSMDLAMEERYYGGVPATFWKDSLSSSSSSSGAAAAPFHTDALVARRRAFLLRLEIVERIRQLVAMVMRASLLGMIPLADTHLRTVPLWQHVVLNFFAGCSVESLLTPMAKFYQQQHQSFVAANEKRAEEMNGTPRHQTGKRRSDEGNTVVPPPPPPVFQALWWLEREESLSSSWGFTTTSNGSSGSTIPHHYPTCSPTILTILGGAPSFITALTPYLRVLSVPSVANAMAAALTSSLVYEIPAAGRHFSPSPSTTTSPSSVVSSYPPIAPFLLAITELLSTASSYPSWAARFISIRLLCQTVVRLFLFASRPPEEAAAEHHRRSRRRSLSPMDDPSPATTRPREEEEDDEEPTRGRAEVRTTTAAPPPALLSAVMATAAEATSSPLPYRPDLIQALRSSSSSSSLVIAVGIPHEILLSFLAVMARVDVQVPPQDLTALLQMAMAARPFLFGQPPVPNRHGRLPIAMRGGGGGTSSSSFLPVHMSGAGMTSTTSRMGGGGGGGGGGAGRRHPLFLSCLQSRSCPSTTTIATAEKEVKSVETGLEAAYAEEVTHLLQSMTPAQLAAFTPSSSRLGRGGGNGGEEENEAIAGSHAKTLASLQWSVPGMLELGMHLGMMRRVTAEEWRRAMGAIKAADDERKERVRRCLLLSSSLSSTTTTGTMVETNGEVEKRGDREEESIPNEASEAVQEKRRKLFRSLSVASRLDVAAHLEKEDSGAALGVALIHLRYALRKVFHAAVRRVGPRLRPSLIEDVVEVLGVVEGAVTTPPSSRPPPSSRCVSSSSSASSSCSRDMARTPRARRPSLSHSACVGGGLTAAGGNGNTSESGSGATASSSSSLVVSSSSPLPCSFHWTTMHGGAGNARRRSDERGGAALLHYRTTSRDAFTGSSLWCTTACPLSFPSTLEEWAKGTLRVLLGRAARCAVALQQQVEVVPLPPPLSSSSSRLTALPPPSSASTRRSVWEEDDAGKGQEAEETMRAQRAALRDAESRKEQTEEEEIIVLTPRGKRRVSRLMAALRRRRFQS